MLINASRIAFFQYSVHYNCFMIYLITISLINTVLFMPVVAYADPVKGKLDLNKFTKLVDGKHIIRLPPGLYPISETIVLSSYTTLEGAGPNTILKAASPFSGQRFITSLNEINGCRNIRLRSFKVVFDIPIPRGSLPGILRFDHVNDLQIRDISINLNTKHYGIDLSANVQNATIENNTIENWGQGGAIMVRNGNQQTNMESRNIIIRNNTLKSYYDEPLAVFGWMGSVRNVTVEGNHVIGEGSSFGITAFGMDTPGHTGKLSDVVIRKNIVRGGRHGAIGIKGGAESITVSDNIILHAEGDGIFIHAGGSGLPGVNGVQVRNNEISDAGRHGIFAAGSEITIEMNKISNTKASGIDIHGTVTVIDNRIRNTEPGIPADEVHKKIMKQNTCRNAPIRILNKRSMETECSIIEQNDTGEGQPSSPIGNQ